MEKYENDALKNAIQEAATNYALGHHLAEWPENWNTSQIKEHLCAVWCEYEDEDEIIVHEDYVDYSGSDIVEKMEDMEKHLFYTFLKAVMPCFGKGV